MLPGSSIGQRLVLTSFGESHGKSIGAVLDGCPAGLEIDEKEIQKMLDQRKPGQNLISTQRKEGDIVEIVSGIFRGHHNWCSNYNVNLEQQIKNQKIMKI